MNNCAQALRSSMPTTFARGCGFFFAFVATWVAAAPAWKELSDVKEPEGARSQAPAMLAEGTVSNPELFNSYYHFRVAEFTLRASEEKLPDLRKRLRADLRRGTGEAHSRLNTLLLDEMSGLARDEAFSPNVRINALLVIGELNAREQAAGGGGEAQPLSDARRVLLEFAQPGKSKGGIDDALAAAALSGLARHAKIGLSDDAAAELQARMLALANDAKCPPHRSEETHSFFRLRATQILGWLKSPGSRNQPGDILHSFFTTVSSNSLPLWLRTTAAECVAELRLADLPNANYPAGGRLLGNFVLEILDKKPSRRGLATYLDRISRALGGVDGAGGMQAVAQGEQKQFLTELATRVEALRAIVQDRKVEDEMLYDKLAEPADELRKWLAEQTVDAKLIDGLPPLAG